MPKRIEVFILSLEKKGKRINKRAEIIVRGQCGAQSFKIPDIRAEKEPRLWDEIGSMTG
jgi:hypothetical protein